MELKLARSKAGHDKGRVYVVLFEDKNSLRIADGKYHTVSSPKKKNKKHVQPILRFPDSTVALIKGVAELTDSSLRKIIKSYEKEVEVDDKEK